MSALSLSCLEFGGDGLETVGRGLQHDFRGTPAGTENNQCRTVPEVTVVGDVELVRIMVAIADGHNPGIALDGEVELILRHRYATALAVDSLDANVHQVGAISLPVVVLRGGDKAHGLARRLCFVSCHDTMLNVGNCLDSATIAADTQAAVDGERF